MSSGPGRRLGGTLRRLATQRNQAADIGQIVGPLLKVWLATGGDHVWRRGDCLVRFSSDVGVIGWGRARITVAAEQGRVVGGGEDCGLERFLRVKGIIGWRCCT